MSIHSKTRLLTHIVWSTHKRERLTPRSLRIELNDYIHTYADAHSMRLIKLYVNPDHVHLFINMDPTQSIASTVKLLKGASSRWLNQQDSQKRKFSWGRGYGAFSVSQSHAQRVIWYIHNQEEHHRQRSFTEEFSDFKFKYKVDAANR
ncbi:MAG: IS200/IS605 family transposase [Candidatus Marinimicrobia bacterium]|nr:IS200/IS605 family transposase [Candidatus Neomarinimicrobiota bacterium]